MDRDADAIEADAISCQGIFEINLLTRGRVGSTLTGLDLALWQLNSGNAAKMKIEERASPYVTCAIALF